MSASDFNKLLSERHKEKFNHIRDEKLFNEYVRFHLPDTRIVGNKTDIFNDGFQLGAIYIVKYDGNRGWWFVVGYHREKESLEVLYGEYRFNKIDKNALYLHPLIKNTPFQKPNHFITDSSIVQELMEYFIGGTDNSEIFVAYSPPFLKPKLTTLNFSRRGFL